MNEECFYNIVDYIDSTLFFAKRLVQYDVDNFFETLSHHSFYRFLLVVFVLKLNMLRLTCQESKEMRVNRAILSVACLSCVKVFVVILRCCLTKKRTNVLL